MASNRQALSRYAFFQQARQTSNRPEDALIPLILPALSGKAGEVFVSDELAKQLTPLFGSDLVSDIAASMVEPLARSGYLERVTTIEDGSIYNYSDKVNSIPISASLSSADRDLHDIMMALADFISVTKSLKPITDDPSVLRDKFVDWITTIEASTLLSNDESDNPPYNSKQIDTTVDDTITLPPYSTLVFSSFVRWLYRERYNVFEKVVNFTELGLIIDLVSEIRFPTKKLNKVNLNVVLDTRILLELLGLYGDAAQQSIQRLLGLCKKYGVSVCTLTHLVDEVKSIAHGSLENPSSCGYGSVNEAAIFHRNVKTILRKVYAAPDALIKAHGITISPYTISPDKTSERFFTGDDIARFTDELPYDKAKPNMAKRDAWSLAFAVRRQNGSHSSLVFDSRCMVLTRSPVFVTSARRYLRSDHVAYPSFAIIPVMELRHFSTSIMLAFGSNATRDFVRAELVASCDRVLRISPDLTNRIRAVLHDFGKLTEDQIDAALSDPATLAEFALTTANDPSIANSANSAQILNVVYSVGTKDHELRSIEAERKLKEEHAAELEAERRRTVDKEKEIEQLRLSSFQQAEQVGVLQNQLDAQFNINVNIISGAIKDKSDRVWVFIIGAIFVICVALAVDSVFHFTESGGLWARAAASILGIIVAYHTFAAFMPNIAPDLLRIKITRAIATKELSRIADPLLESAVLGRLKV